MRVTSNIYQDSLINQLNRLSLKQTKLQEQISSGQKISLPEDDPSAIRRVVNLQEELSTVKKYRQNVSELIDKVSVIYSNLRNLKTISDRANEIAVSVDDLKPLEDLKVFAIEVNHLIEQAVQIINSNYNGNYLFGGNNARTQPVTVQRDTEGRIISVIINSNTSTPEYEISAGMKVTVDYPVKNSSGAGQRGLISDSRTGADFLNHLISLRDNLLSGNRRAVIDNDVKNLQNDESHLIGNIAESGIRKAHLQSINDYLSAKEQSLASNISTEVDVDLTRAIVKLNQTQNAFAAALQTGAVIMNKSLLDYIR